jgi:NAD-dependent dihydropyrimidine dehydrogenase PreA subunit
MAKLTVVISQGQSAQPARRRLEEELVTALLFEPGVEVTVIPHLYDLAPNGTGMLCLQSVPGDLIVLAWLFPRAAHWTLDRNGIRGRMGVSLLAEGEASDEDAPENQEGSNDGDKPRVLDSRPLPPRTIHCLDLRTKQEVSAYVAEVRRIRDEAAVQTVSITGPLGILARSAPAPVVVAPVASSEEPVARKVEEQAARRWYPVIDYSRCTNCMECIDFCLFGVYGVDRADTILVEQPDNCRKGCPACSRVCPENAIIFPQHKAPAIAGSADGEAGGLKIDLSKLFGAPDALDVAVLERDVELVAVGRGAVGKSVGIPQRQPARTQGPRDELDDLIDELDRLSL